MRQPPDPFRAIPPDVLTTDQLAERLGLTAVTIRNWAKDRTLPGVLVGKEWRFWWPQVVIALFYNGEEDVDGCLSIPGRRPPDKPE